MRESGEIHTQLIERAKRFNRMVLVVAIVLALASSATMLLAFPSRMGPGNRSWPGMVYAMASFPVVFLAGWFVGRRLLVRRLRAWVDAEVRRGADRDSFAYVVAMYAKPSGPNDNYDVLPPPR